MPPRVCGGLLIIRKQFQMSPRQNKNHKLYNYNNAALAIEATELNLGIRMMSNPPQTRGGVADKMDCNFTMLGGMLK